MESQNFETFPRTREMLGKDFIGDKAKTSLRLKYEAESRVIRKQLGGLNEIRQMLGLSQRKMCQLLMVDPSAWTRWTKDESKVPPHVWRALQWYIELENKRPEWAQWRQYVLARPESRDSKPIDFTPLRDEWRSDVESLRSNQSQIEQLVLRHQGIGFVWKILLLFNTLFILYHLLRAIF